MSSAVSLGDAYRELAKTRERLFPAICSRVGDIADAPPPLRSSFARGKACFEAGKYSQALRFYYSILAFDRSNTEALYDASTCLLCQATNEDDARVKNDLYSEAKAFILRIPDEQVDEAIYLLRWVIAKYAGDEKLSCECGKALLREIIVDIEGRDVAIGGADLAEESLLDFYVPGLFADRMKSRDCFYIGIMLMEYEIKVKDFILLGTSYWTVSPIAAEYAILHEIVDIRKNRKARRGDRIAFIHELAFLLFRLFDAAGSGENLLRVGLRIPEEILPNEDNRRSLMASLMMHPAKARIAAKLLRSGYFKGDYLYDYYKGYWLLQGKKYQKGRQHLRRFVESERNRAIGSRELDDARVLLAWL